MRPHIRQARRTYIDFRRSGSPYRGRVGGQAVFGRDRSPRRLQDAKVESRHGRFAMRKARFLAFFEAQRSSPAHSGIRDWLSRVRDATSTTTITIAIRVRRGRRFRAPCAPGRFAIRRRQSSTVEPRWPRLDSLDDRLRRTIEVAARRRQRAGQLVAISPGDAPTPTAWRRPAFKARSTTRKLIDRFVSCQLSVVSSAAHAI